LVNPLEVIIPASKKVEDSGVSTSESLPIQLVVQLSAP